MHALKALFDQSNGHHRYIFEPQSRQCLAHGDLWDHLCRRAEANVERTFLPLTLEMGSWRWVKKNPRQLFSRHGIFNPLIDHRQQRVLRRYFQGAQVFAPDLPGNGYRCREKSRLRVEQMVESLRTPFIRAPATTCRSTMARGSSARSGAGCASLSARSHAIETLGD